MAKRLHERQLAAIALLVIPQRGGLTYEQIAEKVGVTDRTIREWRNNDAFNEELKKQVMRNSVEHLPDIMWSVPKHIIDDGNAAMFRTFMQSLGLLTEEVEVESKGGNKGVSVSDMKAKIERFKQSEDDT
ncbi:phBC6A51 family helix-turn-helix protein [Bacillus sp. SCS-151]|uniref:phBC6A51 family helix-turn-helix protein n=1 Tax=Nanhaiella sioensis TaxID=3115293 RepID=UPI00397E68C1